MGIVTLWLFVSYALLLGPAVALIEAGFSLGWLLLLVPPIWRVARRFQPGVGYYVPGAGNENSDAAATMANRITRNERPILFRLYLALELMVILGLLGLFLLRRFAIAAA
ncbi:MAG: hypothetical protein AAGI15_10580 [Pseudomonadota bacterium]